MPSTLINNQGDVVVARRGKGRLGMLLLNCLPFSEALSLIRHAQSDSIYQVYTCVEGISLLEIYFGE